MPEPKPPSASPNWSSAPDGTRVTHIGLEINQARNVGRECACAKLAGGGEVQAAAGALGIEVSVLEIRRTEDIALAFDTLKDRAEALYITDSPFIIVATVERITTLALEQRLPTISSARYWPRLGALMSYGANPSDVFRRSAEMIDKILRGAKPADIPVEQVTRFELVINLKTARTLGLTVPRTLMVAADEVIE